LGRFAVPLAEPPFGAVALARFTFRRVLAQTALFCRRSSCTVIHMSSTNPTPIRRTVRSKHTTPAATGPSTVHRDPRQTLGRRGQNIAIEHFRVRGFRLVTHNQNRRYGEIDLVVFDGRTLVFVEVKTCHVRRHSADSQTYDRQTLGWPSIKQYKAHRRTVRVWLTEQGSRLPNVRDMRFDVVKVLIDEREQLVRLDHIEAAWEGVW
jgi:putative endonuclease